MHFLQSVATPHFHNNKYTIISGSARRVTDVSNIFSLKKWSIEIIRLRKEYIVCFINFFRLKHLHRFSYIELEWTWFVLRLFYFSAEFFYSFVSFLLWCGLFVLLLHLLIKCNNEWTKKVNTYHKLIYSQKMFFLIYFLHLFFNWFFKYRKQYSKSLPFVYIWMFNWQNVIEDSVFCLIVTSDFLIFTSIIYG